MAPNLKDLKLALSPKPSAPAAAATNSPLAVGAADSGVASTPSSPSTTPIFSQFSSSKPSLPAPPTPHTAPMAQERRNPLPAPSSSSPSADGPLWRAIVFQLERRALNLRTANKKLIASITASISALKHFHISQSTLDFDLNSLSIASATLSSSSTNLSGVYSCLRPSRLDAKLHREQELRSLEELASRLQGSYERLKGLEAQRKSFDTVSKAYYSDLASYLAKTTKDIDQEGRDKRQEGRKENFRVKREEFFSYLEGIVEGEEAAVAGWLKAWAGVDEDQMGEGGEQTKRIPSSSQVEDGGSESGGTRDLSESGFPTSDDGMSTSASGGSAAPPKRSRRTSIPTFFVDTDRIKGFISRTTKTLGAALPSAPLSGASASATHSNKTSPPSKAPKSSPPPPSSSVPPQAEPSRSEAPQHLPPPPSRQQLASMSRKKEGFLWATLKPPVGHSSVGDGGGQFHKIWTVLSEGQLLEFENWKEKLTVRQSINLRFATARPSRNTERRFTFEVLTPSVRRVYQAQSEEEAQSWLAAISKSIESLLNGTSSVRQFDAGRLTGSSTPYSLNDFGSTTSLSRHNVSASTSQKEYFVLSPSGGLSQLSNRLPAWMGPPLARRASSGPPSGKSKGKRASVPSVATSSTSEISPRRRPLTTLVEGSKSTGSLVFVSQPVVESACTTEGGSVPFPTYPSPPSSHAPTSPTANLWATVDASSTHLRSTSLSDEDRRLEELVDNFTTRLTKEEEAKKLNKARNGLIVQELVEMEGNNVCADCGVVDPRWASWNLGIFLDIRCSGIHRSLGTHVSKIRSLDLDDWSDEQVASMQRGGNLKSNTFFLATKPASLFSPPKDEDIKQFIIDKYVTRKWCV